MKKIFIALIGLSLILPIVVLAGTGSVAIDNPLSYNTLKELGNHIINFIFQISLAVAPLMIIIGGFYLVTASGDPEKIKTGKKIILYTLIGFLIILSAKGIVNLLTEAVTGTGAGAGTGTGTSPGK